MYEIWIARQGRRSQVMDFYRKLEGREKNRMFTITRNTANEGKYENEEIYRSIGDDIYEFKAWTARIFCFTDGTRIVCTHGAKKPSPRELVEHRKRAAAARTAYEATTKGMKR